MIINSAPYSLPTNGCYVCLKDLQNSLSKTVCKHLFHSKCLEVWLEWQPGCPRCKTDLSQTHSVKLILPNSRLFNFINSHGIDLAGKILLTTRMPTPEKPKNFEDLQKLCPLLELACERIEKYNDCLKDKTKNLCYMARRVPNISRDFFSEYQEEWDISTPQGQFINYINRRCATIRIFCEDLDKALSLEFTNLLNLKQYDLAHESALEIKDSNQKSHLLWRVLHRLLQINRIEKALEILNEIQSIPLHRSAQESIKVKELANSKFL